MSSEVKKLLKFIEGNRLRKVELAHEFRLASTDAIDKWIYRGKLPRTRAGAILRFISGGVDKYERELLKPGQKGKNKKASD